MKRRKHQTTRVFSSQPDLPGQEFFDPTDGMLSDAPDDVAQIGLRIETVVLRGFDRCEIHPGREDKGGPTHKTEGCIRTTDAGTKAIKDLVDSGDPPTKLVVH